MKRLFIIFAILCSSNAFAYITENVADGCLLSTYYRPVFRVNSYTCSPGYFLPADTLGCQPCPSGHTCDGGTFSYHPTLSQGITINYPISESSANMCSSNIAWALRPVFVQNTVNLNFDDGNGNVTSTTCEYGDTVTIPETEPTRTGYVFTGWVVRSE